MKAVNLAKCLALLGRDPNKEENLSQYIRELRSSFSDLLLENAVIREKATLPKIGPVSQYFRYTAVNPNHNFFTYDLDQYLFITITYDPRKFPQLIITSDEEQKKYIEQVITRAVQSDELTSFYGVFERQKNGNIHYHFIAKLYNSDENKESIKSFLTPFFTDRKDNKYCIDVKRVTNIEGLIKDYLIKAPEGILHNLSDEQQYDLNLNAV